MALVRRWGRCPGRGDERVRWITQEHVRRPSWMVALLPLFGMLWAPGCGQSRDAGGTVDRATIVAALQQATEFKVGALKRLTREPPILRTTPLAPFPFVLLFAEAERSPDIRVADHPAQSGGILSALLRLVKEHSGGVMPETASMLSVARMGDLQFHNTGGRILGTLDAHIGEGYTVHLAFEAYRSPVGVRVLEILLPTSGHGAVLRADDRWELLLPGSAALGPGK